MKEKAGKNFPLLQNFAKYLALLHIFYSSGGSGTDQRANGRCHHSRIDNISRAGQHPRG